MSETKIQLNERKVRKGIRNSVKAQQKQMWKKLTSQSNPVLTSVLDPEITYTVTRSGERNVWYYPADLAGKKFDKVIIDEWVEK